MTASPRCCAVVPGWAKAVAERVRRAAHDFGPGPVDDDLAVLVLDAVPMPVPGAALARGPV